MSLLLNLGHKAPFLDFGVELPADTISALVGPSGSGKTSILRAIAGLLPLKHDQVSFSGEVWSDSTKGFYRPARSRPIGLVSQHYALFPHLSVQDNVAISLIHLPEKERTAQARHYLDLAHISGLESQYPHELSGGQKQRVALARAIARQPKVLLLDEPFSAVDRATRKRLYVELQRLHEQLRTTVVLVTHDLDEAAQLGSHIALVRHGRCVQSGPVSQVLTQPASEEAARVLDIPNVFEATIQSSLPENMLQLQWGPHSISASGPASPVSVGNLKFAVLPQNVFLVRPDTPSKDHIENPIPAVVEEVIVLGSEAHIWLVPNGLASCRLQMRLPERAVRRYAVSKGKEVIVSLRPSDVITFGV
jgi:molybdate transport system ATP-binding protein